MRTTTRFVLLGLMTAALALAQEKFSQRLTPDERKAAGLDQLSAEQVAALDALVARDHGPAPAPVAKPAVAKSSRSMPAEAAPSAPVPEKTVPEKKRLFGLPVKEEDPGTAISGTLVGGFRGWTGSTRFQLEDGQTWVQEDPADVRPLPLQKNPRVKIQKSLFGGYKLTVEGDPVWVRVRRVQ